MIVKLMRRRVMLPAVLAFAVFTLLTASVSERAQAATLPGLHRKKRQPQRRASRLSRRSSDWNG